MPRGVPRIPRPEEYILKKKCPNCGKTKPWVDYSPRAYNEDGSVRSLQGWCRECQLGRPGRSEYHRGWRQRNAERERERDRYKRRRQAEARRLDRVPQAGRRLPVGPFRAWLAAAIREHGTVDVVAALTGIDERSITRAAREQQNVTERLADQCFTRTGYHLNDFYGDEAEAA